MFALTMKVQTNGWQFWGLSALNEIYIDQLSPLNKFASTK